MMPNPEPEPRPHPADARPPCWPEALQTVFDHGWTGAEICLEWILDRQGRLA